MCAHRDYTIFVPISNIRHRLPGCGVSTTSELLSKIQFSSSGYTDTELPKHFCTRTFVNALPDKSSG